MRRVVGSAVGAAVVGVGIVVAAVVVTGGDDGDRLPRAVGTIEPSRTPPPPVPPASPDPPPADPSPDERVFPDGATIDYEIVTIVEPSGFMDPENHDPSLLPRLMAEVQVMRDKAALDDLWHELGLHRMTQHHEGSAPPQIDFADNVVLLTLQGGPAVCADPLHLEPDGSTLWLRFEIFEGVCHTRQGLTLYVVAVGRDQLPERFVLDRDYYGLSPPDDRFRQEVTVPPPPPSPE
jgi:hypothetical protein